MESSQEPRFSETLIYTSSPSIQTGKCDKPKGSAVTSSLECSNNGSCNHRPKHAGLCQPLPVDQQHCADLPGCSRAGSRRSSDSVHPCNRRAGLQHLRCNREHDRRTHEVCIPVIQETSDHGSCSDRSKYAGLQKPVHPHLEYRTDIPGSRGSGCGSRANSVHPGYRRTGVLNLRRDCVDDRGSHEVGLQVSDKSKPDRSILAGGFIPRILVFALIAFALLSPMVSGTVISFSPVGLDPDNLQVYNSTGALVGIYNTSSQNIAFDNNTAYSILVVPANDNLLGNHPDTWFATLINKMQQNAPALLIITFGICLLVVAVRRR